jgi:hypothetical protein
VGVKENTPTPSLYKQAGEETLNLVLLADFQTNCPPVQVTRVELRLGMSIVGIRVIK